MLRDKDLVVLVERVLSTKEDRVELNTSLGHIKHLVKVELRKERFSSIDPHRRETLSILLMISICTSAESIEVRRDLVGLLEGNHFKLSKGSKILGEESSCFLDLTKISLRSFFIDFYEFVAYCIPIRRYHCSNCPGSLKIGLIEHWEDPVTIIGLKLSV